MPERFQVALKPSNVTKDVYSEDDYLIWDGSAWVEFAFFAEAMQSDLIEGFWNDLTISNGTAVAVTVDNKDVPLSKVIDTEGNVLPATYKYTREKFGDKVITTFDPVKFDALSTQRNKAIADRQRQADLDTQNQNFTPRYLDADGQPTQDPSQARWVQTDFTGGWKEVQPQGQGRVVPGEAVGGPAGSWFIQDPDGGLRPYTPEQPKLPTIDDTIDQWLLLWSQGDEAAKKAGYANAQAVLDSATRLDYQRDRITQQQGLSYADAVQLAMSQAKTPEEARQWIDILTNPFGDPAKVTDNPFAQAVPQPTAPPPQPTATNPAAQEEEVRQSTGGGGGGLGGASMEELIAASGVTDQNGNQFPIVDPGTPTRPPNPYPGEPDADYAVRLREWSRHYGAAADAANGFTPEDSATFGGPTPSQQMNESFGPPSSLQTKAVPNAGVRTAPSSKNVVNSLGRTFAQSLPGALAGTNTKQANVQQTMGAVNPLPSPIQPGNNLFNAKTGAKAGGILNPFEQALYDITRRQKQKVAQTDYERRGLQTARFR